MYKKTIDKVVKRYYNKYIVKEVWIDWKIASDNTFGANTEYVGSIPTSSTKNVDKIIKRCYN